jgi:RNA polymerase sigma-70 factor (ECF subfamily)
MHVLSTVKPNGGQSAPEESVSTSGGDAEAFRAIFHRYGKPIHVFIYHMIGDRPRAEELTQETFLRAYRTLDRRQHAAKLSTWLFGIARNVVREAIREKRRRLHLVELDDANSQNVHDERIGPDERFLTDELERAIRRALDELSVDQRVVFVQKVLKKMSYQEISSVTGFSTGKLKTDLHRARAHLRHKLKPYMAGRAPRIGGAA